MAAERKEQETKKGGVKTDFKEKGDYHQEPERNKEKAPKYVGQDDTARGHKDQESQNITSCHSSHC